MNKNNFMQLLLIQWIFCYGIPINADYKYNKIYDDSDSFDGECKSRRNKKPCTVKIPPCKKSSSIAIKAAAEAKVASDAQMEAAENAAQLVISQLAEKAVAAAKAADAALAGKEHIVSQLEAEVREGELVVQEEANSLQSSQANCNAAALAAKQAGLQLKTLAAAVRTAQANVDNSYQAANGAQRELSDKQQLVEAAKKRVELLLRQLDLARIDFKKTKQAAERAACAAREAKQRSTRERRNI